MGSTVSLILNLMVRISSPVIIVLVVDLKRFTDIILSVALIMMILVGFMIGREIIILLVTILHEFMFILILIIIVMILILLILLMI